MKEETKPVKLTADNFRVRCSGISKIMGKLSGGLTETKKARLEELREKSKGDPLTEKQRNDYEIWKGLGDEISESNKKKLEVLEEKAKKSPLTEKQQEELELLEIEKDKPFEIPQGAKTYVEKWVKDYIVYKRVTHFGNKYTKKGNDVEDESIKLIEKYFDLGFISKNKVRKFADFIEGECDVELSKCIIDAKNSYTHDTFPIFEDTMPNYDYECQMQGYMYLYDKQFALVCYLLTNATEELILKECQNRKWELGLDEVTEELYEEIKRVMTYDDVNIKCRVKVFRVNRNDEYIKAIEDRVKMCREYAKTIIKRFLVEAERQPNLIKP